MSVRTETCSPPAPGVATNAVSIAALVISLFAFLMVWIPVIGLVSWLAAPLGMALGIVALLLPGARKAAIAAIILSALAFGVCLMWWSAVDGTIRLL